MSNKYLTQVNQLKKNKKQLTEFSKFESQNSWVYIDTLKSQNNTKNTSGDKD